MQRCYLAGPDVFHPAMPALASGKRDLCAGYGLQGCFPLDNATDLTGLSGRDAALAIYRANIRLIESCDMLIANLTPFRGISADPGTVFELGYMSALGRPVAGYTLAPDSYLDRARAAGWLTAEAFHDSDGQQVEDFGLGDNLMLAGALQSLSASDCWVVTTGDWRKVEDHLAAFDLCLRRLALG
jgi:nucleoside 2-deoxyribosyltransferase